MLNTLKEKYTLLCLDPSQNCTGWAVIKVDGKVLDLVDYGYIDTKKLDHGKALILIESTLDRIINLHKPDYVAAEQMFAGNNRKTAMVLGQIHGVLLLVCAKHDIEVSYYAVMTAKSQVLGGVKTKKEDGTKKTGIEMKEEVAQKVIETFGAMSFQKQYTNDVTDAVSMGLCFIKMDGKTLDDLKFIEKQKKKAEGKKIKIKKEDK